MGSTDAGKVGLACLARRGYGALRLERRHRWAHFASGYSEAALAATGRRLVVVDPDEVRDDLVHDMVAVLTSMGARPCGRRSARHRAEKAPNAAL